jgi:uncharacterized membrane protein
MSLRKELPLIAMVSLPIVYLAFIWKILPEKVPVHWNISAEIDRYGGKKELLVIPMVLPLLVYLVMVFIQKIYSKKGHKVMVRKLQSAKAYLTIFMSIIALLLIYLIASNQGFK